MFTWSITKIEEITDDEGPDSPGPSSGEESDLSGSESGEEDEDRG